MCADVCRSRELGARSPALRPRETQPADLLRDFASRGLVVLPPDALGVDPRIHAVIYEKEKRVIAQKRRVSARTIPEILDVLAAPGLAAACDLIVGKNCAIVPFTHNTPFASGAHDQHWHKDDNAPLNGRKQRHHHAVQVELLYYPQAVAEDMGPTATLPYSQYWAFNHEENHDNFPGADHLDFGYYLEGMERVPASGPKSPYLAADIRARRTKHDERMAAAVAATGWPLMRQYEAAPLAAGSVVIHSHNLFHRGNHRRDDWRTWKARPRFMWRFWLYRTTEPEPDDAVEDVDWASPGIDPVTGVATQDAPEDMVAVWRHHYRWLRGAGRPKPVAGVRDQAAVLTKRLYARGDAAEPTRVGAAYRLAAIGDDRAAAERLGAALRSERETVRRAAMYGLAALGQAATETLLDACAHPLKWVRKAAVFALGEAGEPTPAVGAAIAERLAADQSVYVRAVAAAALGCVGRRAIAAGVGKRLLPLCARALVESLAREPNRLGMNLAQRRSIKLVRPTDECDVCEGIGTTQGQDRFAPVRSAVRENALWSAVILCSHGAAALGPARPSLIDALATVARTDRNIFSVGLALDALNRLAHLHPEDADQTARAQIAALTAELPTHCLESLARGTPQATAPGSMPLADKRLAEGRAAT